jgi:hypothetical protein
MEVAIRKPSKEASIALWQHEFYAVDTRKLRGKVAKNDINIYQALIYTKRWSSGRDGTCLWNVGGCVEGGYLWRLLCSWAVYVLCGVCGLCCVVCAFCVFCVYVSCVV